METVTTTQEEPRSIASSVIDAVADADDVDPLDLPPLYGSIDPDALESIFATASAARTEREVRFTYAGYRVTIDDATGDAAVRVERATDIRRINTAPPQGR